MLSTIIVPRGGMGGKVFRFTRSVDMSSVYSTVDGQVASTVISSGSPDIVIQYFASLALLPNLTDFQNLFSVFKIRELEFHFINCMYTEVNGVSGGINGLNTIRNGAIYVGKQNDLLSGTSTIQQIQQEEGVTVRDYVNNGKPIIVKIVNPTVYSPAQDASGLVNTSIESSPWLDTQTSQNVAWRGCYLGFQDAWNCLGQPGATANRAYTVRCKFTMDFKGVR